LIGELTAFLKADGGRTHEKDCSEIDIVAQEHHECLSFGVPETHVVFQDLGAIGGEHEACEEEADERESYGR
jgi:hypothetical protein